MTPKTLAPALLLSLATLTAVGCSKSAASPTEPAFLSEDSSATSASLVTGESRAQETTAAQPAGGNGLTSNREPEPGDDRGGRNGGGRNSGGRNGGGRNGGGRDDGNRAGTEFEAAVASINGSTITLATGGKVVVNAATVWSARGDLHNLAALRTSLNRNLHPRIEGRGTRQANGAILAKTLKAEF